MALTDGAVAQLARRAADLLAPDARVRVRPSANDDPYRWGGHGWIVTIGSAHETWIPAEASEDEAMERLRELAERVAERNSG
jgi:hypothetical protein